MKQNSEQKISTKNYRFKQNKSNGFPISFLYPNKLIIFTYVNMVVLIFNLFLWTLMIWNFITRTSQRILFWIFINFIWILFFGKLRSILGVNIINKTWNSLILFFSLTFLYFTIILLYILVVIFGLVFSIIISPPIFINAYHLTIV